VDGDVEMRDESKPAPAEEGKPQEEKPAEIPAEIPEAENKPEADKQDKMEVDGEAETAVELKKPEVEAEEAKDQPEKKYEMLHNPSRVTPNQRRYISWGNKRYTPVSKRLFGVILVEDRKPEEETKLVEFKTLESEGVYGNEPKPPAPFKYLGD